MSDKAKQFFRVLIGVLIFLSILIFSFKFLLKGPPFIKVLVLLLNVIVGYLVYKNIILKKEK